jgi:hypothetical protein
MTKRRKTDRLMLDSCPAFRASTATEGKVSVQVVMKKAEDARPRLVTVKHVDDATRDDQRATPGLPR